MLFCNMELRGKASFANSSLLGLMSCLFSFQLWCPVWCILAPVWVCSQGAMLKSFLNGTSGAVVLNIYDAPLCVTVSVVPQSCQMTCLIYSQLFIQVCIQCPLHRKWEAPGQVRDFVVTVTQPLLLSIKMHSPCRLWLLEVIILIFLNGWDHMFLSSFQLFMDQNKFCFEFPSKLSNCYFFYWAAVLYKSRATSIMGWFAPPLPFFEQCLQTQVGFQQQDKIYS